MTESESEEEDAAAAAGRKVSLALRGSTKTKEMTESESEEEDAAVAGRRMLRPLHGTAKTKEMMESESEKDTDAAAGEEPVTWVVENFCWFCHLEEPLWNCPSCIRSFHIQCCFQLANYPEPRVLYGDGKGLKDNQREALELLECSECIVAKNTTMEFMKGLPKQEFTKILKTVCGVLRGYYDPNPYINILDREESDYADDVKKVMDITTLEKMVDEGKFLTLEGFFGELKWLMHNTVVREGELADCTAEARDLLGQCKDELRDISQCPSCYINCKCSDPQENWFVKACKPPHLLMAVKYANQWWPAKLKFIDTEAKKVGVSYFGDHTKGKVLLSQCRIMSKEYIASSGDFTSHQKKGTAKIDAAKEELQRHLETMEETYGKDGVVFPETGGVLTDESAKYELQKMFLSHEN